MKEAEASIRALVELRLAALRAGDVDALAARLADDVLAFDVVVPMARYGALELRERLEQWLDSYDGPLGCELRDLDVHADGDVGFASAFLRFRGTLKTGERVDMWVRSTLGCERRDGHWLVVHEHTSDPMDVETGRTRTDLEP